VNQPLNPDQGIEITRAVVADCLARDVAEVRPESRLITDLGADSLDFIDLIFTLEKRFGVRIRENDLNVMSRPDTSSPEASSNAEFLSPDAISRLLPWLPELRTAPDLSHVRPNQVWPLITVEALWRLVELKSKSDPA
jgi:acyl carrier protein